MSIVEKLSSMILEETSAIPLEKLLAAVIVACIAGILISVVYRFTYGGVLFSKQFALGLILMAMITSTMILAISSNLVLSLGMVGALSIVRFRTAIKEPMDTIFMFWSLAAGILTGAGFLLIALLATLIVGALFVLMYFCGGLFHPQNSYLLVLRCDAEAGDVQRTVLKYLPSARVKSTRFGEREQELVLEVRMRDNQMKELKPIRTLPFVHEMNLVSNQTETQL